LPLWLLGLPVLRDAFLWGCASVRRAVLLLVPALGLAAIAVSDNVAFFTEFRNVRINLGIYLTESERELLREIDRRDLRGVLLCDSLRLSYTVPTYTSMRPYRCHPFYTPDYQRRLMESGTLFQRGEVGPWFESVDFVLVPRDQVPRPLLTDTWERVVENSDWLLFGRRDSVAGKAP
jgi:hypothetical protein